MKRFQFSKAVDDLAERVVAAPIDAPVPRNEIFKDILSIPDFPNHFAAQMNDMQVSKGRRRSHWGLCWEFITVNKVPNPDAPSVKESFHGRVGFTDFRAEDALTGKKRAGDIYPLTRNETRRAREYLRDHPQTHAAVAGIQASVVTYLHHLSAVVVQKTKAGLSEHADMNAQDKAFRVSVLKNDFANLIKGAESHSFLRDMSPILGAAFAAQGNGGDFTYEKYRAGLLLAFERNAFMGDAPESGRVFVCPFRSYFAQVLATKVERHGDGVFYGSQGDKTHEFGALLSFMEEHFSDDSYAKPMSLVSDQLSL